MWNIRGPGVSSAAHVLGNHGFWGCKEQPWGVSDILFGISVCLRGLHPKLDYYHRVADASISQSFYLLSVGHFSEGGASCNHLCGFFLFPLSGAWRTATEEWGTEDWNEDVGTPGNWLGLLYMKFEYRFIKVEPPPP